MTRSLLIETGWWGFGPVETGFRGYRLGIVRLTWCGGSLLDQLARKAETWKRALDAAVAYAAGRDADIEGAPPDR